MYKEVNVMKSDPVAVSWRGLYEFDTPVVSRLGEGEGRGRGGGKAGLMRDRYMWLNRLRLRKTRS